MSFQKKYFKKKPFDKQVRFTSPAYLKLEELKYQLHCKSFSSTIEKATERISLVNDILEEFQTMKKCEKNINEWLEQLK